jgi:hypothetical protein
MRVLLPLAMLLPTATLAQTATELWRTPGFALPESAHYEASNDRIIVSNIGVFGPDGGMDGRLSLVTPEGAVDDPDWITGLMDPKGMASRDGILYVADATGLHVIDIAGGTVTRTIPLDGNLFPNDVTVGPDGTVYVTAFFAGGVWAIRDGVADWALAPGGAPLPNGILWQGEGLILGSFGDEMTPDFTVKNPGGLLSFDPATGAVTPMAGSEGSGSVDGIVAVGDWLVYDDNPSGRLMGWRDGTLVTLAETGAGAADLGVMGNVVLVPSLATGELTAWAIE